MSIGAQVNERLAALTEAGVSVWLDQIRRTLITEGELQRLVDEYSLTVCPIVLGSGKKLWRDAGQVRRLELVDSTPTTTGSLILTYRPA